MGKCKEMEGYTGPDATAPSMEEMNNQIVEHVVKACLSEIKLKNGQPALTLFGAHTHHHINPSGKFIIGGPQGDAGLTGRKIIIDTYGGWGAHGGGAFSGKDPTKVDRSAAYACRQMAKSVVKSGLCKRALVQLSYAIGVAKPLSLFVETYGTEQGGLTAVDVTNVIKIEFDCRPGAIAMALALREPKYQETAAYCHFGRQPHTKDGIKFFEWENAKDLSKYKTMNSSQVDAALKSSNYLTKWVDWCTHLALQEVYATFCTRVSFQKFVASCFWIRWPLWQARQSRAMVFGAACIEFNEGDDGFRVNVTSQLLGVSLHK